MITVNCSSCGTPINRYPSQVARRPRQYCILHKGGKANYPTSKVLDFIIDYKVKNDGNSPSREVIARGLDEQMWIVRYALLKLVDQGKIKVTGGKIEVVGGKWELKGGNNV